MTNSILIDAARLILQKTVLDQLTDSLVQLTQEVLRFNSTGGLSGGSSGGGILGTIGSVLGSAIGGYFGGGVTLSNTGNAFGSSGSLFNPNTGAINLPQAKGNVFDNGEIIPFASGGIVSSVSDAVMYAAPARTSDAMEIVPFASGGVISSTPASIMYEAPHLESTLNKTEVIPFADGGVISNTPKAIIQEVPVPVQSEIEVVPFAKGGVLPSTSRFIQEEKEKIEAPTSVIPFAKGGLPETKNEVVPFGVGDVITAPTFFQLSGGKTGLMAEEREEAIVPLSRNTKGELGVSSVPPVVNIEIINQSGAEIETQQKPNGDVTMIIKKIVSQDVVNGGPIYKSIRSTFGIAPSATRRG